MLPPASCLLSLHISVQRFISHAPELSSFGVHCCAMTRKYELKRRAERKAETRRRIVEATVALHTSDGPARTTISAIADRAGVERHTVYAHFPDERALFDACSAHWASLHPFPDSAAGSRSTTAAPACGRLCAASTTGTRASSGRSRSSSATPRCTEQLPTPSPEGRSASTRSATARPRLAAPQARDGRAWSRTRVRDVAFARPWARAHAEAGGGRDVELRRKRLAFAEWRPTTIAG